METKVLKKNKLAIVPAGILEGTEAFWYNNEKWVLHEGKAMRFHEAPGSIQRMIANACLNDKQSQSYMRKCRVTKFSDAFDWWYKCVIGALDSVPDFINGKFVADAYNNTCTENCPHRGRFCSLEPGLKNFEVDTIKALKAGKSIAETADDLHISAAAAKSRIEKIKVKLDAPNMASMMSKAVSYGI